MEPKKEFITLSRDELCDIDGGIAWVAIGIVVAGAAIFGVGVYNGYKDTKDSKK